MSETKELFAPFPGRSKQEWIEKIQQDLKGEKYEDLLWHTEDGMTIEPIHHADDRKGKSPIQFSANDNDWKMRQNFELKYLDDAIPKIKALEKADFDAIGVYLEEKPDEQRAMGFLEDFPHKRFELYWNVKNHPAFVFETLSKWASQNPDAAKKLQGGISPGTKIDDLPPNFAELNDRLPAMQFLTVDGLHLHYANYSMTSELAALLHVGAQRIEQGLDAGLSVQAIHDQLVFNISIGKDYFREIAKLRAFRLLWSNVIAQYDSTLQAPDRVHVHGLNSFKEKSEDPYKNLLQSTTIALAAVAGGVNMLSLDTWDETKEKPKTFFERITRNIQLLLYHESKLNRVADPYNGSYYVEELTEKMAKEAWGKFLELSGG